MAAGMGTVHFTLHAEARSPPAARGGSRVMGGVNRRARRGPRRVWLRGPLAESYG
jgi:hypothetical protein